MDRQDLSWRKASHSNGQGNCVEVSTWRKASYSNGSGNCVEVGAWRKASYSSGSSTCVEVTDAASVVLVRDTTDRDGGTLEFSAAAWRAFAGGLKRA